MGYDDRREILERLEALERLVRSRHEDRGRSEHDHRGHRDRERCDHHHHDRGHDHGDGDFDEKRVIDTIVRLVSERVGCILEDQQARSRGHDDGGSEKRVVDLIVGLVSEHVQEIVAMELDRRFGRPAPSGAGEERSPHAPPIPPPSGDPGAEQH